jgi:hypothetical protein
MIVKQKMQDDLTAVKGIGPARRKWLGERFAVYSFEALGRLTVEEIEEAAREAGKILPNGEVAGWIAQAKRLAAEKESRADLENAVETAVPTAAPLWKPIASFVVEFQEKVAVGQPQRRTRVHYMEADMETTWPGIEREQLGLWIEQHVQVNDPGAEPVVEARPEPEKVDALKPTQVRIRQRPDYVSSLDMSRQERPFLGHVHHEEPITLEVDFELDAPAAGQSWQQQAAYSAQCEVHNLTSGQKTFYLEMEGGMAMDCLTYKTKLSEVEPGMYSLAVLLRGKRPLGTSYFELPKLNVL